MRHAIPITALTVLCIALLPSTAAADHQDGAWAKVLNATPVTEIVRYPADQQVCWDQQVQRPVPEYRSATPLIIGGLIGGVIGNQIGDHHSRGALTAFGAALGTSIAADQQARRYPPAYTVTNERRCRVETRWREESRVVAWDVTYEYRGEVYQTRMDHAPGDHIRVRVSVEPVH